MKQLLSFLFFCALSVPSSVAQHTAGKQSDSLQLTAQERVDTLVKYVRKEFYTNNYGRAIEVGSETLKMARKLDDHDAIFRVSSLLGNAFLQLNDTIEARRIFFRTIQEAERRNDTTRSMTTARIDLGNLYALQEKKEYAILKYKEALPLAEKLKDSTHLFILNYNIAELSLEMEDLAGAEYHVAKTNEYVSSVSAGAYHAVAKLVTGRLLHLKNDPETALPVLQESIRLAKNSGYNDALIEAYEVIAKVEMDLGSFESAAQYLMSADELKKEKYKTDKIRAVETITTKFKIDQYQQDLKAQALQNKIDLQEAKRETTAFWTKLALGIVFVAGIIIFFSFLKRKKLLKDLLKKNKQYLLAKEEIETQAMAKNRLFSNITHELRTPLYGIIGISSLLLDDKKLGHQSESLNSLKFSADYLLSLINNVLQFTRMDTEGVQLKNSEFDIRNLINSVVESSKFLNTSKPNNYNIHIDQSVPNILVGDDIKLSQVLMNLVSNASKFTHGGTIDIQVGRRSPGKGDEVCLQFLVRDTGMGISKQRQEHIFDEFSGTSSDYEHQGTGLGLPIVKKILALYGSEIKLESTPGQGTKVSFELCYGVGLNSSPTQVTRRKNRPQFIDKRILVVDDNRINQLVTAKTLKKHGAAVSVASNGKHAIALAQTEDFDLILMDINMPHMNGFETTEIIRSFGQDVPIVALTAVEEEKMIIKNTPGLFNAFVIKPYNNEDFLALITKYTGSKAKLRVSI